MITYFCIGFLIGNIFNWIVQWWKGRRMYLKYRNLIEPVVMKVFHEEERERDE